MGIIYDDDNGFAINDETGYVYDSDTGELLGEYTDFYEDEPVDLPDQVEALRAEIADLQARAAQRQLDNAAEVGYAAAQLEAEDEAQRAHVERLVNTYADARSEIEQNIKRSLTPQEESRVFDHLPQGDMGPADVFEAVKAVGVNPLPARSSRVDYFNQRMMAEEAASEDHDTGGLSGSLAYDELARQDRLAQSTRGFE